MIYLIYLLLFVNTSFAKTYELSLSEKVTVKPDDVIKLKGTSGYIVVVGGPYEPVKCAMPGQNCGAGYVPPRLIFDTKCSTFPCPFFLDVTNNGSKTAHISIENEESCAKKEHNAKSCFYQYGRDVKSAEGCSKLKTPLGKYYCLRFYAMSALPEHRGVCDELPENIYGLRETCYKDWASRYKGFTPKRNKTLPDRDPCPKEKPKCPEKWADYPLRNQYCRDKRIVCDYDGTLDTQNCQKNGAKVISGSKNRTWCQKLETQSLLLSLPLQK